MPDNELGVIHAKEPETPPEPAGEPASAPEAIEGLERFKLAQYFDQNLDDHVAKDKIIYLVDTFKKLGLADVGDMLEAIYDLESGMNPVRDSAHRLDKFIQYLKIKLASASVNKELRAYER